MHLFEVKVNHVDNQIISELVINSYFFEPDLYEYAFYLYKDGSTFEKQWYSNEKKTLFDINHNVGVFFVRCFIRDKRDLSKRALNSEKLNINTGPYYIEN